MNMGRDSVDRRRFLKGIGYLGIASIPLLVGMKHIDIVAAADLIPTRRPSYVLYIDGGMVVAQNSATGTIDFSGTDAALVINQACKSNSKVLIKAGTYNLGTTHVDIGNSNVELYGEGPTATVLRLAPNTNSNALHFYHVSNINVHDLQIDGNRMNQSQNPGSPAINAYGITASSVTGLTIANCYVHDCRDFGINVPDSSNVRILNNLVQNCDANGISVSNERGGSGAVIQGNTVDGASDVGISTWYANDCLAVNNTVRNITMSRSPWSEQSHIGMMVEHGSNKVTYRNNSIENCGSGLSASGGTNTTFDGNNIKNCLRGLYSNNANDLTVTNCTFDTIAAAPTPDNMFGALRFDSQLVTATISGCEFRNIGQYMKGGAVIQLLSPQGKLTGNIVHTYNGKYRAFDTPQTGWTVQNNTILP